MTDEEVWRYEESLWTGDADHYRESIDPDCVMVLPEEPFAMSGTQAIEAVAHTPRWSSAELSQRSLSRLANDLIAISYRAHAMRGDEGYTAWCSSTYHKGDEGWRVVQHSQTVPPIAG